MQGEKQLKYFCATIALLALLNGCVKSQQPTKAIVPQEAKPTRSPKADTSTQDGAAARSNITSSVDIIEVNENLSADNLFDRGFHRQIAGDTKGAIKFFNLAIRNNPEDANSYYYRGVAHSQMGLHQQALADFTKTIEFESKNPHTTLIPLAYINRGDTRAALGDKQQALADYQKAANLYQKQGEKSKYQEVLQKIKSIY